MNGDRKAHTTPTDLLRMLLKHKKKVFVCLVATMAAVVAAIVLLPRTYMSDASLFVRVGRESVALDPTATTGETITASASREVEINNVLGVLRSRVLAEKVVDLLGPATILGRSVTPSPPPTRLAKLVPKLDPITDREQAIRHLRGQLEAEAARNSDIISVRYEARTPAIAQKILATVIDAYLDEHVRLYRRPESHSFFAEQAALIEKDLTEAIDELRDAKNEARLLTVDGQRTILHAEMSAIETDLLRRQPVLEATRMKAEALRAAMAGLPERVMTTEVAGNPNVAADTMRSQLYVLEAREAELASKFQNDFPQLIAVREQVAALKEILAQQKPERSQFTTVTNPTRQLLEADVVREDSTAKSLEAEVRSLGQQQDLLKQRFEVLNNQEAVIADLERNVASLQTKHKTYLDKLEQSRINEALASERITNVNVMQPASYVEQPASPKKAMLLVLGMIGATLLGFTAAATAEGLSGKPSTPVKGGEGRIVSEHPAPPRAPRRRFMATH